MASPNYRRYPMWNIKLFPFWRPIFLNPIFFKDDEKDGEGWRERTWGVSWLFLTVSLEALDREHDGKAGFL